MIETQIATWSVSTEMRSVLVALGRLGWRFRLRRLGRREWTARVRTGDGTYGCSGATAEGAVRGLVAILDAHGMLEACRRGDAAARVDPVPGTIATWPVSTPLRTTLSALEQLGWDLTLARPGRGAWQAAAAAGGRTHRCHGPTPEYAVQGLIGVLDRNGVLKDGWHVVVRPPAARHPVAVRTWVARRVAERHAAELAALHPDAAVFLVRFAAVGATLELAAEPAEQATAEGVLR